MIMRPRARKIALIFHVIFAVGWLGAVASFLVLSITGMTSEDAITMRAAYLGTGLITSFVILPLGFASPLSGLLMGLGGRWGLFRHYWVLIKFFITIFATIALLIHLEPISVLESAAGTAALSPDHRGLQIQLVVASAAALLLFITTTSLAVYKPQGRTKYGRRKQLERLHAQR